MHHFRIKNGNQLASISMQFDIFKKDAKYCESIKEWRKNQKDVVEKKSASSHLKSSPKQFVFGLLNRFSVDVKDGFNLFEQKLYINVSYINRANNGNSANSDLFMISAALLSRACGHHQEKQ